jgi:hypothetical protein
MASVVTKWCQPGKDRYSIDLLEQLDPYQKSLMEVAEKNKDKKGRDIPSRIVINYFTQQYPQPKWLRGPVQLEYLVGKTDNGIMRIYNLHDSHVRPEKCKKGTMMANEWIIKVIKSADVFIDVFIESAPPIKTFFGGKKYKEHEYELHPGALSDLVKELNQCITQREDCPAPNSRIHGVDVRQIGRTLQKQIGKAYPDPETSNTPFEEAILRVINLSVEIFASVKMQKEIRDLPKCIFKKLVEKFRENLKNCLLEINIPEIVYADRIKSLTMCIGGILMDIYLLGRLFKTFDVSGEKGHPDRVHNAIIYTGFHHAIEYKRILTSCGFEVVFENQSSGDEKQCVNISEMPYPLFRG